MTNEELYEMSIKPQLYNLNNSVNELKSIVSCFTADNTAEHKNILSTIDIIQNGNGIIGHKQLANEWKTFNKKKTNIVGKLFQIILVCFNCILTGFIYFKIVCSE